MKNIYFIRHGEVHNPQNILYGRLPQYRLSELGENQVNATAGFLSDRNITSIYSSPLLRARQTALIIAEKLKIPLIQIDRRVIEILTHFQGKSWDELHNLESDFLAVEHYIPGDETIADIEERMVSFIFNVPRGNHVVVTHGDPWMVVSSLGKRKAPTLEDLRPGNDTYVRHAEVLHIELFDNNIKGKRVFHPAL